MFNSRELSGICGKNGRKRYSPRAQLVGWLNQERELLTVEGLGDGQNSDKTSHGCPSWRPLAMDFARPLASSQSSSSGDSVKPLMTNSVVKVPRKLWDQGAVL